MEMKTTVTENQVKKRLASEIGRAGGVRALSREWGVSAAVISMTANGRRRPGPAILARLRIEASAKVTRRVVYTAAT